MEDVYCDSIRLNQILINLLSNAMKFTPVEGNIKIYLSQEEIPGDENHVRCHFRVKDNGMGMSPEFQKKIFETFSRKIPPGCRKQKVPDWEWRLRNIS